jgi:hypothetical protein
LAARATTLSLASWKQKLSQKALQQNLNSVLVLGSTADSAFAPRPNTMLTSDATAGFAPKVGWYSAAIELPAHE